MSSPTIGEPGSGEPGSNAQVFAINTLGQMVGQQDSKAIVYDSFDSTPMLLKDLVEASAGWHFTEATDLSETGEIIVTAYSDIKQGEGAHALKLVPITPVPEPSTWMIFAACGIWAGRKKLGNSVTVMKARFF